MATGVASWSTTASSNATADSAVLWSEGQAPSTVNDSGRGMMSSVAKFRDDISGGLTTGGTSTAYTVTSNQVFASLTVLGNRILTIIPHATSGAAPTLAVDGLTAKALNIATAVAVPTGYLIQGTPYIVYYGASVGEFIVLGANAAVLATSGTFSTTLAVTGISSFTGTCLGGDGTVSLPQWSFTNDTDCGHYRISANRLGLALNGAKVVDYQTTGVAVTGTLSASSTLTASSGFTVSAGAVSLPAASVAAAALAAPSARVLLQVNSPSGVATSVFEGLISATYRAYEFVFYDIIAASGSPNFIMQMGTGGTPTYDTGNTYQYNYFVVASSTVAGVNNTTTSYLVGSSMTSLVGQGSGGTVKLINTASAASYKIITHEMNTLTTSFAGSGRYISITPVTAVRFLTSSGNFSGTIVMYGIT